MGSESDSQPTGPEAAAAPKAEAPANAVGAIPAPEAQSGTGGGSIFDTLVNLDRGAALRRIGTLLLPGGGAFFTWMTGNTKYAFFSIILGLLIGSAGVVLGRIKRRQEATLQGSGPSRLKRHRHIRIGRGRITKKHAVELALLSVVLIIAGCIARPMWSAFRQRIRFYDWGIPVDFSHYSKQFKEVRVQCFASDLSWLPPGLERLSANCFAIDHLGRLPSTVKFLDLSNTAVSGVGEIPDGVEQLNIAFSHVKSLRGFRGKVLNSLVVSGFTESEIEDLPETIITLTISDSNLHDASRVPGRVEHLTLEQTRIKSLEGLPENITALELHANGLLKTIDELPAGIRRLTTDRTFEPGLAVPSSLRELHLIGDFGLDHIPSSVTTLRLNRATYQGQLPPGLLSLQLDDDRNFNFSELPRGLESLKITIREGSAPDFSQLPANLHALDLSDSSINSISGVQLPLTSLDLSGTKVRDLLEVPANLEHLRFQFCSMVDIDFIDRSLPKLQTLNLDNCTSLRSIKNLPANLVELSLKRTPLLESLGSLPGTLKKLDISGSGIQRLEGLPVGLESLTVHFGQLKTLDGLPPTVSKISFELYQATKRAAGDD
jgi:Leucine-rich repeat (LRR) protein